VVEVKRGGGSAKVVKPVLQNQTKVRLSVYVEEGKRWKPGFGLRLLVGE